MKITAETSWVPTAHQTALVRDVARGLTNKELARTRGISDQTIKHLLTNLYARTGTQNRAELVIAFLKRGSLTLEEL